MRVVRRTKWVALAAFVGILAACGPKPTTSEISMGGEGSLFYVVRMHCNLLRDVPPERLATGDESLKTQSRKVLGIPSVEVVPQGDEVEVIGRSSDWVRVKVRRTGTVGWLHSDFVVTEKRSTWWHGDTDSARETAKRIFQDKYMVAGNYPVTNVTIEEAWNQLRFETDPTRNFAKDEAKQFVKFWLEYLRAQFPKWKDHFVYLTAYENGVAYSAYVSNESADAPTIED